MRKNIATWVVLVLLGVVSSTFVEAQAVVLNVSTRWQSNTVLTSRLVGAVGTLATFPNDDNNAVDEPMTADDEVVYINADLNVTTNTPFWAVQVDCTATNTMLETYGQDPGAVTTPANLADDDTDNLGDNLAVFTSNDAVVGVVGVQGAVLLQRNTTDRGKFSITISRISTGVGIPFGVRGITTTFTMGTIRLRVKPQISGINLQPNNTEFKGSPTLVCTSSFVDRNGASVGVATYTAPKPLRVIAGYSINGTAKYQGQTNHAGIIVECGDDNILYDDDTPTDAMGNWKISGYRLSGEYYCWAYPNKVNPSYGQEPDAYLPGIQYFTVTNDDVQLLPMKLFTGDVDRTGYTAPPQTFTIDTIDLSAVTGQYNTAVAGPAFRLGDANGDTKVDRADLALVTGNFGLTTQWLDRSGVSGGHIVLSGQTASSAIIGDNRILINDVPTSMSQIATTQLVTGTNRDFWATVSPNGKQIAFSRSTGTGVAQRYQVFVAPIVSGVVGVPVRVSTGTTYDESAPSWSPDGQRLAYTCSPVTPSRAIQTNSGSLCLSSTPGVAAAPRVLHDNIKIYPPAWLNNGELVYGGKSTNPNCADSLCLYNLSNLTVQYFDNAVFLGGTIEDMPVVRGRFLYYRSDDGNINNGNTIYITTFAPASGAYSVPAPATLPSPLSQACSVISFHMPALSSSIEYYTLQDNTYDLLVMAFGVIGGNTISANNNFLKYRDVAFCPDPVGSTTNPTYASTGTLDIIGLNANIAYNPANPSDIYATRISLQWLP